MSKASLPIKLLLDSITMPSFYPPRPTGLPLTPPEYPYYNGFRKTFDQTQYYGDFINTNNHRLSQPFAGLPPPGFSPPPIKTEEEKEKPVGGVSAYLDYEISDMADFVSQVASGCEPKNSFFSIATPSPAFRKFVFQILTSTRLPSSTILLGLEYLQNRPRSKEMYKTLTVALLLASKFLDDNTFQNRSWAEVTGIPVLELNSMEAEWLAAIDWRLHRADTTKFEAWRANWKQWLCNKGKTLAPIDTQLSNRHSISYSYRPPYEWSPPVSGPTTPEYVNWYYQRPPPVYHHGWQCGCIGCVNHNYQNNIYNYGQPVAA